MHPWNHQAYWLGAYAVLFIVAPVILLTLDVATVVHLDVLHLHDVKGWTWIVLYAAAVPTLAAVLVLKKRARAPTRRATAGCPAGCGRCSSRWWSGSCAPDFTACLG